MSIPSDCRYSKEHEWAKLEDGKIRVGISDYAQQELGDIVFIELPEVGRSVKKGETFANVESVKAVSDIYAPVDGTIAEINATLESKPEQVNTEPHNGGWLVVITPDDPSQLDELLGAEEYQSFVAELSK